MLQCVYVHSAVSARLYLQVVHHTLQCLCTLLSIYLSYLQVVHERTVGVLHAEVTVMLHKLHEPLVVKTAESVSA